jgi:hypothetical protein
MGRRRLALAALAAGLGLVVAAQRLAPISGPPLYDGVVVEDEYKWLSPPAGYQGGATSAEATVPVQGGQSPNVAVATSEQPPQAQVFAGAGYLDMPPLTTSISVSIVPVQPAAQPADGVIAGNVYRFTLTGQGGAAVSGQASGGVTVVLRGPRSLPAATIERYAGGTWTPLATDPAGVPHTFTAVVTDFGDFALVAPPGWVPDPPASTQPGAAGPAAPPSAGPVAGGTPAGSAPESGPPLLLIGGLAATLALVVAGVVVWLLVKPARPVRPAREQPSRRSPRSGPPARGRRTRPPRPRR